MGCLHKRIEWHSGLVIVLRFWGVLIEWSGFCMHPHTPVSLPTPSHFPAYMISPSIGFPCLFHSHLQSQTLFCLPTSLLTMPTTLPWLSPPPRPHPSTLVISLFSISSSLSWLAPPPHQRSPCPSLGISHLKNLTFPSPHHICNLSFLPNFPHLPRSACIGCGTAWLLASE